MTKKGKFLASGAMFANIILAGAGVVCLLSLSYFVYYYAWTAQRQFTSSAGVLVYYVSPALLAVLLFASLRLNPSRKINLALCLCSAGASLYALDVLLTLWSNLPSVKKDLNLKLRAESAKERGVDFDTRSYPQVIDDLRSRGIDPVPSVFPGALLKESDGTKKSSISINGIEVLPLASIANRVTVLCNESAHWVTYRSDEHGFNNPQHLWDKAPIDIVALGDSYVHGHCVPADSNFVALIRHRYPATLNLGIEADGPLLMLAKIEEYAQIVKPKVVLWFYYEGNDLFDIRAERNVPLLTKYLAGGFSQRLFARQSEIDRALTDYVQTAKEVETAKDKNELSKLQEIWAVVTDLNGLSSRIKGSMTLGEVRQRIGLVYGSQSTIDVGAPERERIWAPQIDLLHKVLLRAKNSVSKWRGNLYFVYLPAWGRYAWGQEGNPERDQVILSRDQVLLAAKKAGLPIIDVHRSFMTQKDPLMLFNVRRLDSHYNEEGHRLVAEEVLRSISVLK